MRAFHKVAFAILVALVSPAALRAETDDAGKLQELRKQTLLYGIDSQVIEIVQKLKTSGDKTLTVELAAILEEDRSQEVRRAILELFGETGVKEGEKSAKAILSRWQDYGGDLLVAAMQYLSAISASDYAPLLVPLMDAADNAVASAAIRALGKSGDRSSVDQLLSKLSNPDFTESAKADLVLALGDLGDPRAVGELLRIAGNTDENKMRRMYAADSLGKIGDPSALVVLKGMFDERDALLRSYVASSLSHFDLAEVFTLLVLGLKDENWKVRVQCAKGLARPLSAAQEPIAVPVLSFKAEFDPTSQVRVEAIRALGEIGGDVALSFLGRLYVEQNSPPESRVASLESIARKDLPRAAALATTVLNAEWKSVDQKTIESTARVISTVEGAALHDVLVRLLDSANPTVRSYGIRGIAMNRFSDLKDRLAEIAQKDPHPAVRREAERALGAYR